MSSGGALYIMKSYTCNKREISWVVCINLSKIILIFCGIHIIFPSYPFNKLLDSTYFYWFKNLRSEDYIWPSHYMPHVFSNIVEGSLFRHKINISSSKLATCHACIRHNPLASHMKTTYRHVERWNREPSIVPPEWPLELWYPHKIVVYVAINIINNVHIIITLCATSYISIDVLNNHFNINISPS